MDKVYEKVIRKAKIHTIDSVSHLGDLLSM